MQNSDLKAAADIEVTKLPGCSVESGEYPASVSSVNSGAVTRAKTTEGSISRCLLAEPVSEEENSAKFGLERVEKIKVSVLKPILETSDVTTKKIKTLKHLDASLESSQNKLEVLARGVTIGSLVDMAEGDYRHIRVVLNEKTHSFWCFEGCEQVAQNFSDLQGRLVQVQWREVRRFIPEAGETKVIRETLGIVLE